MALERKQSDGAIANQGLLAGEVEPSEKLTLTLRHGGEASFRYPTVTDMKVAESQDGAIIGGVPQPDLCRNLAQRTLIKWLDSAKMPADDRISGADDQAVVTLFKEHLRDCGALREQGSQTLQPGVDYEVFDDGGHGVVLSTGDRIKFRELTRTDLRASEKAKGGGTEANLKLAIASCVLFNDEKPSFGDMVGFLNGMELADYYLIVEVLSAFL